jgi:hypothetical protein
MLYALLGVIREWRRHLIPKKERQALRERFDNTLNRWEGNDL